MNQTAVIQLVKGSAQSDIKIEDLKNMLVFYQEQVSKTGKQLGWDYASAAFPYTIENFPEADDDWFYLKGTNELYKYIVIGFGEIENTESKLKQVQVVLPSDCTHGDKAKANELCKFIAKQWKAELRLFNGRKIHYHHYK